MHPYVPASFQRRLESITEEGFSLVELAIVLVILGLLAGGILAGQSLIRAAQLRGLTADSERFTTATYAFRDKYRALPGDMPNAADFWGPWSTTGTPESVRGAKNGDHDGYYGGPAQYERAQFFRHLALAGLIEGSYAGNYAEPANLYTPGVNVPISRVDAQSRILVNSNVADGVASIYGKRGSYLIIQGQASPWSLLTPPEMWSIDTKRDDGNPSSGAIMGISEGALADRNCTSDNDWVNAATGSATYNLSVSTKACWPLFWFR